MMVFTEAQFKSFALVPKFTGFASVICSSIIVYHVLREKNKQTYHRLLCGISFVDILSSFWMALSTWPTPETSYVPWSAGNETTCNVQAFFIQFGFASSFYNASLSIFYLLTIRYDWRRARIQRIEPFLHAVPLLWGLCTAIAGLVADLYTSVGVWCWISKRLHESERWALAYGPLWTMIAIVTINCFLIWMHVKNIENRSNSFAFMGSNNHQESMQQSSRRSLFARFKTRSQRRSSNFSSRSTDVAIQSFGYAIAFYIQWIPYTISQFWPDSKLHPYSLLLTVCITTPLQGIPNFIVYFICPKIRASLQARRQRATEKETQNKRDIEFGANHDEKTNDSASGEAPNGRVNFDLAEDTQNKQDIEFCAKHKKQTSDSSSGEASNGRESLDLEKEAGDSSRISAKL